MREILFRGKRIDNGEWVYGYLNQQGVGDKLDSCGEIMASGDFYISLCGCNHKVDPATVGQYTGLTDKNGVKIFEGDIVQAENPKPFLPYIRPVEYKDTCFIWGDYILGEYDRPGRLEVIGNIHDNPELLEENP